MLTPDYVETSSALIVAKQEGPAGFSASRGPVVPPSRALRGQLHLGPSGLLS